MAIKKHDFIEITYTGSLKGTGEVFDTTDKAVAEKNHLHNKKTTYGPVIICIGAGQLLKGLESKLTGKEAGKHSIDLTPEEAFGKKNAKLIQLIPTKKFIEQKIKPVVGLQINIDGYVGTVKTVSGGRTVVDFNHPLANKEISYALTINRIVTDNKEKLETVFTKIFGLPTPKLSEKEGKWTFTSDHPLPDEAQKMLKQKVQELTGVDITIKESKPLNTKEGKKTSK
jgi:FKBP-type peptidyl-prolyl cis-trans isomerase 2